MTAAIIDGRAVAADLRRRLAGQVAALPFRPCLTVVLLGNDPASAVYVRSKDRAATEAGIEARTIRSWVAQGLLPAPITRGPAARYPVETLERVLAIRAMRDGRAKFFLGFAGNFVRATPDSDLTEQAMRACRLTAREAFFRGMY